MNQFNQVFESKLKKLSEMTGALGNEYTPVSGEIFFNVDIFYLSDNPTIKVITGVKNNPQGISITKADYYMIITNQERFVASVQDIKNYMRNNIKHLKPCMSDDFKYAGYEIPYPDFKMLSQVLNNETTLKIAA